MTVHFYLRYPSRFGETLFIAGNTDALGNYNALEAFPLTYLNDQFWQGTIEFPGNKQGELNYSYILREDGSGDILDADRDRTIEMNSLKTKELTIIDTWNDEGNIKNVFYTKPFQHLLLPQASVPLKLKKSKTYSHVFKVKTPLLSVDEWPCITGSGIIFKNWDVKKLLPLQPGGNWFTIKINFSKEEFPVKYKYGIYNKKSKTFEFENGSDRVLESKPETKQVTVLHDGFINKKPNWKGAGVAIPVFSLRSKNGFGTGEFNDIKLLADWAKLSGLKLLQLLPVNDTTATYTEKDSYPYAAVSAFALHPIYINLSAVAGTQHSSITKALNKNKKQLNELPHLDYESVIQFKLSTLKEIYEHKKDSFLTDINYFNFFELNREWLVPYAAFCFLRDKYHTADFTKWKTHKVYKEAAVQRLVSPTNPNYHDICFHYFTQYHLHLQLKEASDYAHKKGIVLKGDIPIGVSPHSCDVWVDPTLYNTNEQAGAPPDDFAVKGQNWGLPTYNWGKMKKDGYAWWQKRLGQMDTYFDAYRLDHILGFFRIWSIPLDAVEGVLGRFVPAIPLHITEFEKNRIWFDFSRYCTPFITAEILQQQFGEKAGDIKEIYLNSKEGGNYQLKENFDTQRKVENYFRGFKREGDLKIKQGLFNLLSNVILIEETSSDPDHKQFHFRIAMHQTSSFHQLDPWTQKQLSGLYDNYFFSRQDPAWKKEAMQKLPALKRCTDMLVCGEDLGMVPHCVPEVMNNVGILSLEIQRMPKDPATNFFHPGTAPYLSVVMPSTHDMSTVREWWEEKTDVTQKFYNNLLGYNGKAPDICSALISKEIILQHLSSPAMWSIFQLQDLLGMSNELRREDPFEERINQPADPAHLWKYRMHISLEELLRKNDFSTGLKTLLTQSDRS